MLHIRIKKLNKDFKMPERMTNESSCYDIYSATDILMPPKSTYLLSTGFSLEIPKGYEVQIRSRSGLALKENVYVLNAPGTIDSDYKEEVKVILKNGSKSFFAVKKGMRIAQMIVCPVIDYEFTCKDIENDKKDKNRERVSGFGSTGV